jgi:flagellar secretion chaperone FliS
MRNHPYSNRAYQNYFDNQVLAATPLQLIGMLYDAALDAISGARRHIRHKDIRARVRAINKALRIVTELSRSLDHEAGGELSRRLAAIYRYVTKLLVEANSRQNEALLAEAENLMATLGAAWKACRPPAPETAEPQNEVIPPDIYVTETAAPEVLTH